MYIVVSRLSSAVMNVTLFNASDELEMPLGILIDFQPWIMMHFSIMEACV